MKIDSLALPLLSLTLAACGGNGSGSPEYTEDVSDLAGGPMGLGGSGGDGDGDGDGDGNTMSVPPPIDECAEDECAYDGGVEWRCRKRFVYGVNWAWDRFAADFGGKEDWGIMGVSGDSIAFSTKMADMKNHGVNVIRWWVLPDFRGDGVTFESDGTPTGLGGTFLDDVSRALELAQIHDLYIMFTIFSFDSFRPRDDGKPHLTQIVGDADKLEALLENVVRPLAAHVENHEHSIRMHSWDLINEPEWAMIGPSIHGDPDYLSNDLGTETISHGEMDSFLADVHDVIKAESSALTSIGTTLKWAHAWDNIDVDFHQLHYYPWLEPSFPLDVTRADLGLDDKPIVLGEFPMSEEHLANSPYTYAEYLALLQENGWAGALGWDWNGATLANKRDVQEFAEANSCETAY